MSEKKVYFDKVWQGQVEEVGCKTIAGGKTIVKLKIIGSDFAYDVRESDLESDRFEEVGG